MRPYCLSKEELVRFIEVELEGDSIYDDETQFQYLIENWRAWDIEFICLATAFSQILEQRLKSGKDALFILRKIYDLLTETGLWLTVEGFNEEFVAYFLNHERNAELTIEEDLTKLRSRLSEYRYP